MIQRYDFVVGIETEEAPTAGIASVPGDVFVLGNANRFTLANNQSAANVTGAVWLKTVYRSVWLRYTIYRSASGGSTRAETGTLQLVNDGTNWEVSPVSSVSVPSSDDAGVDFSITSAGQLQYVSDDNGGAYSAPNSWLDWKVIDINEV